jgi:hypothetical protein
VGRRAVRLAVTGFLVMLAAACSGGGWSGPSLRPAGTPNPSTGGLPAVSAAHHALVGGMLLCLTGPGRAVITGVRPIHPVGTIEVLDYATRPNPILTGGEQLDQGYGTLRTNGFTADRTVDATCGASDSGQGDELALELSVPAGTDAGTTGWQIDYRIGDHAASVTFPLGAVLCSTASMDDKPCKRVWQQYGLPW